MSVLLLVMLVALDAMAVLSQHEFDTSEYFLNTDRAPHVISAAPVGQNLTAVLFQEFDEYDDDLDPVEKSARIMFLDEKGDLVGAPLLLRGFDMPWYSAYSGERMAGFFGTEANAILVYMKSETGYDYKLHVMRIDARRNAVIDDVELVPGFNISAFRVTAASAGETIHILLWRAHGWCDGQTPSTAFYVRSADGGNSWERPVEVHDGIGNVSHYSMTVRGEHVTILMLGVHYHLGSEDWDVTEMVQSSDGGATFGEPTVLQGASIPATTEWPTVALAQNGSLLLFVGRGWLVLPSGEARQLEVPAEHPQYYPVPLQDPTDPLRYRADAYAVRDVETVDHGYRYYVLDLNGSLVASYWLPIQRSRYEPRLWTRAVDGRPQAVIEWPMSDASNMGKANEVRIVERDPATMEVTVVGKPYEVVFFHTEAERAAQVTKGARLMDVAWALLVALIATSLVASALRWAPPPGPMPDDAVLVLLTSMFVITILAIFAGALVVGDFTWEHTSFDFFGLFYVVEGIFLVEVLARTSRRSWPLLGLRAVYGTYGMLLVTVYAVVQRSGTDSIILLVTIMTVVVWVMTLILMGSAARRHPRQDGPHVPQWVGRAITWRIWVSGILTFFMLIPSLWGLLGPPLI